MLSSRFVLGDSFALTTSLAEYPAGEGWQLHIRLIPDGSGTPILIDCTASGDSHVASVAAATTATWTAGAYNWAAWVEDGTDEHTVETGQITLVGNPRTALAGIDLRSDAEIALANVRATIHGTATAGVLSYAINGRELRRYSMEELLKLESKLITDVNREQAANDRALGRADRRKVYVRMARA